MLHMQGHFRLRENKILHTVSLIYTVAWVKIVLFNMSEERTIAQSLVSLDLWFLLIPPLIFYTLAMLLEMIPRSKPMRWTKVAYLVMVSPIAALNLIIALTTHGSMGAGALIYAVPMVITMLAVLVLPVVAIFEQFAG